MLRQCLQQKHDEVLYSSKAPKSHDYKLSKAPESGGSKSKGSKSKGAKSAYYVSALNIFITL
jgi:hypothetical protein